MRTFDKIDYLLKCQGIKQVELCNYLGISKNRYTDWKAGRISSYVKYLPKIADFLGVTIDYLADEDQVYDEIGEHTRRIANLLKRENGELKLKILYMTLGMSEEDAEISAALSKNTFEYEEAIANGIPEEEAKKNLFKIEPLHITDKMFSEEIEKEDFNSNHPEIRLKRIEELKRMLKNECK